MHHSVCVACLRCVATGCTRISSHRSSRKQAREFEPCLACLAVVCAREVLDDACPTAVSWPTPVATLLLSLQACHGSEGAGAIHAERSSDDGGGVAWARRDAVSGMGPLRHSQVRGGRCDGCVGGSDGVHCIELYQAILGGVVLPASLCGEHVVVPATTCRVACFGVF